MLRVNHARFQARVATTGTSRRDDLLGRPCVIRTVLASDGASVPAGIRPSNRAQKTPGYETYADPGLHSEVYLA